MSKKSLGLKGAHDYGAGMRAYAEKCMPGVADSRARGGKPRHHTPKHRAPPMPMPMEAMPDEGAMPPPAASPMLPPQMPPGQMKKGGKVKKAMGGKCYAKGGEAKGSGKGFDVEAHAPKKHGSHGAKKDAAYGGKPIKKAMGGGVAGIRKGASDNSGKPTKPNIPSSPKPVVRFRGRAGIGGR